MELADEAGSPAALVAALGGYAVRANAVPGDAAAAVAAAVAARTFVLTATVGFVRPALS